MKKVLTYVENLCNIAKTQVKPKWADDTSLEMDREK